MISSDLAKRPRMRLRSGLLVVLLFLLTACGSSQTVQPTPTSTGNASKPVPFSLGIPQEALNSPVVGNVPDSTKLHVVVTFKPNDPLLNKINGNGKNTSGQGTDVANLANQLGITDQQYEQMKQYFGVQGVSLNLSKLHTSMTVDANAGTFASLLHTTFVYHEYKGRKFYAPSSTLMIPQGVVEHIQAINGLDSYNPPTKPQSDMQHVYPLARSSADTTCDAGPDVVTMPQIRSVYNFNAFYKQGYTGKGVTIILPEFAGFNHDDLQAYLDCVQFHGKISIVDVDNPPTELTDASMEPLLDLEMITGLLPDANIVVYETAGSDNGLVDSLDVLTQIESDFSKNQSPAELSYSWGFEEDFMTINGLEALDEQFKTLAAEHINLFVSSGDCGAYLDYQDYPHNLDVSFPSSDPYAISVGGTDLTVAGNGSRGSEVVWQGDPKNPTDCENSWGSGGGNSEYFNQPSWQKAPGTKNKYSDGRRQLPDVSAIANNIACLADDKGELAWFVCAGTSAASPIWAAAYGLINQALATKTGYYVNGTSLFYWMAQNQAKSNPFYDVQKGNNLYYPAGPGWDYSTGLGTPNLVGIYNALIAFIQSSN